MAKAKLKKGDINIKTIVKTKQITNECENVCHSVVKMFGGGGDYDFNKLSSNIYKKLKELGWDIMFVCVYETPKGSFAGFNFICVKYESKKENNYITCVFKRVQSNDE